MNSELARRGLIRPMTDEYQKQLGEGLVLRTVRDERDVEDYAAFHQALTGEGAVCSQLLRYHPEIGFDDFQLVEDVEAGAIVSTTCTIPWHCQIEDIDVDVAMLEMVATHPDYRHRGLIRTQIARFHQTVRDRGFDLSLIEGIPYYYRQYGYAYACDYVGWDAIAASRIPRAPQVTSDGYVLHPASSSDISALSEYYERAMAQVQVRTLRSPAYWRFLIEELHHPFELIERAQDGHSVGYVSVHPGGGDSGPYVAESWVSDMGAAMPVLNRLAEGTPCELRIAWPEAGPLVQLARRLGASPHPTGQWLLRIRDVVGFLWKLGPVLERRLEQAACATLTTDMCINLYREAYVLRFEGGRLRGVHAAGFVDASMGAEGGDLNIPPDAFVRLILGYRGLDALRDAWPDIVVKPESRLLLDALFPEMSSYFCLPYHVFTPPAQAPQE